MKKISIALIVFMSFLASGFAQTDSTTTHVKKTRQSTVTSSSTGMKKDGTPDMRLKANRQAKMQASSQNQSNVQTTTQSTQAAPAAPAQTQSRTQTTTMSSKSNVKSSDPSVGTDAKGRTIYQGSRGGKYVMTANGNKEYIKTK